jgi:hypothetical protein
MAAGKMFQVDNILIDAETIESDIVQELIRRDAIKVDRERGTVTLGSDQLASQIRVLLEIKMARKHRLSLFQILGGDTRSER